MKIKLTRVVEFPNEASIGVLEVPGCDPVYTLEDKNRKTKIKGKTRIPAGTYRLDLRTVGRLHKKYARFPFHKGMIWLRNVPGFTYVYIHIGNTVADTEGCILVGTHAGQGVIRSSVEAYSRIYTKIAKAIASPDGCSLEIKEC